jgi:hypothetical protein
MASIQTEAEPPKLKTETAVKEELEIKDLQKIIVANKAEQRKTVSLTTSVEKEETKDLSLFSTFQSVLVRIFSANVLQTLTAVSPGPKSEFGDPSS